MQMNMSARLQNSSSMHSFYYATRKETDNSAFKLSVNKNEMEADISSISSDYTTSDKLYEQMNYNNYKLIQGVNNGSNDATMIHNGVSQVSEWPNEDTLNPAFITFNKGLTGYNSVEYFYDLECDEDNPTMYMRTKSGDEESYYKLDINSVNISTATKAELLGYYSYQEYSGKDVDMYQLMADMEMSEHNGYVSKSDNLQEAFLKYTANWLQALERVWENQKCAGDDGGAAATRNLIELS